MITIAKKELLTLNPETGVYSLTVDGDDINSTYYHIVLSNNYEFYICGWWDPQSVGAEIFAAIQSAEARETSDAARLNAAHDLIDSL